MKPATILGGLIGALVGAAVWYWYETSSPPREAIWAPLLIGVLAGVGARLFATPIVNNWRRGALVAVIALLAMVGTRQGVTYALQQQVDVSPLDINPGMVPPPPADETSPETADEPIPELTAEVMDESGEEPDEPAIAAEELPSTDQEITESGETLFDLVNSGQQTPGDLRDGFPMQPTASTEPAEPPLINQEMLVALSYAIGTLLAYLLGAGPSLRKESQTVTESQA